MSFTVAPDFPAVLSVWTIRSFNGAPGNRPFGLAGASPETRCWPLLFAHRAFIAAEILALAAALILRFFLRRGAPLFSGGAFGAGVRGRWLCRLFISFPVESAGFRVFYHNG